MKLKVIDGGYTHGWWNVEFSCGVVVGSDGIFRIFVPMSRQFCRLLRSLHRRIVLGIISGNLKKFFFEG